MAERNSIRNVDVALKRASFLSHLGLIAGVFQELEVDKLIDEKLPKKRDHKISHSIRIPAMVINGLGFLGQRLYLFPNFFKNISTGWLFGEDVTKEYLNQCAIGDINFGLLKNGRWDLKQLVLSLIVNQQGIPFS